MQDKTASVDTILAPPTRNLRPAGEQEERYPRRFVVRGMRRVVLVDIDEIDWIQADGNYVRLHHSGGSHLLRRTMTALEQELDPRRFVRVHRSAFVRIDRVREYAAGAYGDYEIVLRDGRRLPMSRGYRSRFIQVVSEWVRGCVGADIREIELHIQNNGDERRVAGERA